MKQIVGALLVLSACAAVPAEEEMPVRSAGTCNASGAQRMIGQAASSALGAEALRNTGSGTLRWIPEGSAVTMDYREDRLNIELDSQNRVKGIRCG